MNIDKKHLILSLSTISTIFLLFGIFSDTEIIKKKDTRFNNYANNIGGNDEEFGKYKEDTNKKGEIIRRYFVITDNEYRQLIDDVNKILSIPSDIVDTYGLLAEYPEYLDLYQQLGVSDTVITPLKSYFMGLAKNICFPGLKSICCHARTYEKFETFKKRVSNARTMTVEDRNFYINGLKKLNAFMKFDEFAKTDEYEKLLELINHLKIYKTFQEKINKHPHLKCYTFSLSKADDAVPLDEIEKYAPKIFQLAQNYYKFEMSLNYDNMLLDIDKFEKLNRLVRFFTIETEFFPYKIIDFIAQNTEILKINKLNELFDELDKLTTFCDNYDHDCCNKQNFRGAGVKLPWDVID